MQQYSNQENFDSYGAILKDVAASSTELIRNEIRLAKEELKSTISHIAASSVRGLVGAVICFMAIPPFVAFLVIGLGTLLDGNYWLSALLVSLTFAAIGAILVTSTLKAIRSRDFALPQTRNTLEREAEVISANIGNVRNATKRRAV